MGMKAVKNTTEKPAPKLMALLTLNGGVYLQGPGVERSACVGPTGCVSSCDRNLTALWGLSPSLTPVYEGESITITF
jgi:hypothetical protein|tara:strand:+ start:3314 stop:3544 length:231 start_codon:yes stop_codon:yes gene_type:complete